MTTTELLASLRTKRQVLKEIQVPEWELTLWARKLSTRDRLDLLKGFETIPKDESGKIANTADAIDFGVELLALSMTDSTGGRPFDSDEGREFLRSEDFALLRRLTDEALELNGLLVPDKDSDDTAKKLADDFHRLFAFRLCLVLGYPHPDKLLDELTWEQFTEWQEYYDVEPWGEERADLRNAALAGMILGSFAGSHRLPEPTYPYFSGDADAVDLAGTADALQQHLERMWQVQIKVLTDQAEVVTPSSVGNVTPPAEKA